ncbi:hypothetical protein [Pseudoalteromonas maricaloris]|uniref:hypothetical protein n=1 Tax=Pseudoalteromonas maricaloris TaxID=184924 RepID=UPI003C1F3DD9
MSASYTLRIDFDRSANYPERVFNSMGRLVEGFDKLHSSILLGFGKEIEFSSSLSDTREGSVIADIKHKVIDKIRDVNFTSICDAIYRGVEKEIAVTKKLDSESDMQAFAKRVYSQVADSGIDLESFMCESEISLYGLADAMHQIHNALSMLSDNDKVQFGRDSALFDISKDFSCPRSASQIFEDIKTDMPSREVVIVRRSALVLGLKWDLESNRRKQKKFTAKMSDEAWFDAWKSHNDDSQLWPGDGILADIRVTRRVNKYTKEVTMENEIIKVHKIIPQEQIEQTELDLHDERD